MTADENSRRKFLSMVGPGVAGASIGAGLVVQAHATEAKTPPILFKDFNVTNFGAIGDGKTLDTGAINQAIVSASAKGGTVTFPAGSYLCHSIRLKSNVTLYLENGATIVAADPAGPGAPTYDAAEPNSWDQYQDYGHSHWHNSLIWGEDIENVSILGPGLIWGKGLSRGWSTEAPKAEDPGVGNKAISLKNCHNVTLRDFSILHGGHFAILATGVDNLTIDNLMIDTNRDGMDIDCCYNVRVSNCSVNSPWDDGICLKSSFGLGYARATEAVTITNCYVTGDYEEGTLLSGKFKRFDAAAKVSRHGRIKFGTESNGGFKNITVSNCVFDACKGLALETVDGGLLEDVTITNITMRDVNTAPIFLRLGSRMRGPSGVPVGRLRRVMISNVMCSNAASAVSSIISGIPEHEIEDVKFSNIFIQHRGGATQEDAAIDPPEKENAYPDPDMFGPMPSHGFYIRHVRGIEMSHIEIQTMKEDARPAFVLKDVKSVDFLHVKVPQGPATQSFGLSDVEDFDLHLSRPFADTHLDRVENKKL